jgi:hypothetical protein
MVMYSVVKYINVKIFKMHQIAVAIQHLSLDGLQQPRMRSAVEKGRG